MLTVEDCQRRADEYARLAEATRDPVLRARYRQLEIAWLYRIRSGGPSARPGGCRRVAGSTSTLGKARPT
jgi:hypothetical protein